MNRTCSRLCTQFRKSTRERFLSKGSSQSNVRRGRRRPLPISWRSNLEYENKHSSRAAIGYFSSNPSGLSRYFSFAANAGSNVDQVPLFSWNQQATEFLKAFPVAQDDAITSGNEKTTQLDISSLILQAQELLDLLLSITWHTRLEEQNRRNHDSSMQKDHEDFDLEIEPDDIVSETMKTYLSGDKPEANLAFQVLDRMIGLESQHHGDVAHNAETVPMILPQQDRLLSVVLQLWRDEWMASSGNPKDLVLTPSEIIAKLDEYRMHGGSSASILLLPDVQCYNILLDGAATNVSHAWDMDRIEFCQQLYDWMWTESKADTLLEPDRVSLRAMCKAWASEAIATGNSIAAQHCENLIDDYMIQKYPASTSASSPAAARDKAAIAESLIHIWAPINPDQAHAYLNALAEDYIKQASAFTKSLKESDLRGASGAAPIPPSTTTWNRVLSAYALEHERPDAAAQLLETFWEFAIQVPTEAMAALSWSQRVSPDLFSYNTVLEGWAKVGNAAEANKVFLRLSSASGDTIRPNVMSYTSAIKANAMDWERATKIALDCLEQVKAEQTNGKTDIQLDHGFFHTWLQVCRVANEEGHNRKAQELATEIVMDLMPAHNVSPTVKSFDKFLDCFLVCDDLEGATHWLLQNVSALDENVIIVWVQRLLERGDIELVSFFDKLLAPTRSTPPKTLLQVLVQGEHVKEEPSLVRLLSKLSTEQGLQVLQWIPLEYRSQACFAVVLRKLAEDGDGPGAEELWSIWQSQSITIPELASQAEMYMSLITAWSKHDPTKSDPPSQSMEKALEWYNQWKNDDDLTRANLGPTLQSQAVLLSSLAQSFRPKQAETFLHQIQEDYTNGYLRDAPDIVLYNLVLKAWVMAANGTKAEQFMQQVMLPAKQVDVISYNSVIRAYCQERKPEKAFEFCKTVMVEQNQQPPDLVTFRTILTSYSKSRDRQRAVDQARAIHQWMKALHKEGILKENPNDPSIQRLLDKIASNHRKKHQKPGRKQHRAKKE